MELLVKHLHPIRAVGAVTHGIENGNYGRAAGQAFGRLMGWVGQHGLGPRMTGCAGMGDAPGSRPDAECRYTAMAFFAEDAALPPLAEGLEEMHLPAGRYACAIHRGPYDGLAQTWGAVHRALAASDMKVREGACYEVYLNSPADTAPEDLATEIRVAVG